MRLDEISSDKEQFVRGIKDPAAKELHDIANQLNKMAGRGYSFNAYNADKETAQIVGNPPAMDVPIAEMNVIAFIKREIGLGDHWVWDTWSGDAEEGVTAYVIRKT
jgi:hypothetical protein